MLDEASAHLERSRAVWLSANRPSGAPHTTPVWFVVVTGAIWISIAAHRRKVALLRRDPRVSLAFDGTADVAVSSARAPPPCMRSVRDRR